MPQKTLQRLGEFGLIDKIRQLAGTADHLQLGIGDDCSIQEQRSGYDLLTSTDLLLEGVHFNRQWTTLEQLGHKAAAVNISDIAAMGGTPKCLFLGLACPQDLSVAELEQLITGFTVEARTHGAVLAGGDTCRSPGPLALSVTIQGEVVSSKAVRRDGAQPGDAIYVSGTLGDSALALNLLSHNKPVAEDLLQRHHCPSPRVALGQRLAEQNMATAMIDVSDGLKADLGHIVSGSGVGAEIEIALLPLSESFVAALENAPELIELALGGGEDYELLFTTSMPRLQDDFMPQTAVTRIGTVSSSPGIRILTREGHEYHSFSAGFDHFA